MSSMPLPQQRVQYETIYARVPKPTKRKIEILQKKNGYPSLSQTINHLVENSGSREELVADFVKVLMEVQKDTNKPLGELTIAEALGALQRRYPKNEK